MKVGIACAFRHCPDEDGLLIPASELIPDGPNKDQVLPIIGYLAYSVHGEVRWSFVKYEAPVTWPEGARKQNVRGQIATTRVASIRCPSCSYCGPYPIRGDGRDTKCPMCLKYVESSLIKETSCEFGEMLGNLRDPLENAARAAESSQVEFEFPQVIVTATGIPMSSEIDATTAGAIEGMGYGATPIQDISGFDQLLDLAYYSPAISISPQVVTGVLESDDLKRGWTRCWPVFSWWAKLFIPEPRRPRGPVAFKTVRF